MFAFSHASTYCDVFGRMPSSLGNIKLDAPVVGHLRGLGIIWEPHILITLRTQPVLYSECSTGYHSSANTTVDKQFCLVCLGLQKEFTPALAMPSSTCTSKLQTHPIVRARAPYRYRNSKFLMAISEEEKEKLVADPRP
jgi:hypothetical protein